MESAPAVPALPAAPAAPLTAPAPVEPAAVAPAPQSRATVYEIASWILVAFGIGFVLWHNLLPALLSGMFVYAMVHRLAVRLIVLKMEGARAKLVALLIISLISISLLTGVILVLISIVGKRLGNIPRMMDRITEIVDHTRVWFTSKGIGSWIPESETLHQRALDWLKEHSAELKQIGGESGRSLVYVVFGVVLGALLSFHAAAASGPLAAAFCERVRRFEKSFEQVFFAQVKISALNTAFTAIYLLVALPLFGVNLHFKNTLIAVTFIAGLIPVLGNLVSNSVIVLISLGAAPGVAIASLVFLLVIHKLEYFLNAKIVGGEIHAAAWEILLAMVCFEAAFGIPGVIIAPVVYAYAKTELKDRQLI